MIKLNASLTLKNHFSEIEIRGLETIIQEYFEENHNIENVEMYFGLPYDDTSSYAALWNTNVQFEIEEGVRLQGFAITENNIPVAIGWDENEREYLYRLEMY